MQSVLAPLHLLFLLADCEDNSCIGSDGRTPEPSVPPLVVVKLLGVRQVCCDAETLLMMCGLGVS